MDELVTVMRAYFDGSEMGGYYTVAGYIFDRSDVRPFERLWSRMLTKFEIDHFHMTDCNAKQGAFRGRDDDCDPCARQAIRAISQRATQGIVAAIRVADFEATIAEGGFMPSAFSMCAYSALMMCSQWAEDINSGIKFDYAFESGDEYEADLNQILDGIGYDNQRRKRFHYKKHVFHSKRESFPVQAADIIAWHACKQWGRDDLGRGLRGDFEELVRNVPTRKYLWSEDDLREAVETPRAAFAGFSELDRVAGLRIRRTDENAKAIDKKIETLFGFS